VDTIWVEAFHDTGCDWGRGMIGRMRVSLKFWTIIYMLFCQFL
jgi:hypothetical protein